MMTNSGLLQAVDNASEARQSVVARDYLKLILAIDYERGRLLTVRLSGADNVAFAGEAMVAFGRIVALRDEIGSGG